MDNHSKHKEDKDAAIVADDGPLVACPARTDAGDHLAGGLPGLLVGGSRVEVTARTEEESRETDESEGDENGPRPTKE